MTESDYSEDDFSPVRKKKQFLLSELEAASQEPFLVSDIKKKQKETKQELTSRPSSIIEEEETDWLDNFVDLKIKPKKKGGYKAFFEEDETKKGKKKKKKESGGITDYEKKFSAEEQLLSSLLTDQMNLTAVLQDRLDHMMKNRPASMGVTKYTTDFIESVNQARQLAMNLVDKKVGIRKTIADLTMKEREKFGKLLAQDDNNLTNYSSAVLKQVMENRQELNQLGAMPVSSDIGEVSDLHNYPDLDSILMNGLGNDQPIDDEAMAYLRYENEHVTIYVEYRGQNNDPLDYDFIARDAEGNIVEDYPVPYKTKLSINRSTGRATDSLGEQYPIIFLDE